MYDSHNQQAPKTNRFRRYRPLILFIIVVAIIFIAEDYYSAPVQEDVKFAKGVAGDISKVDCPFPLDGDNHVTCYRLITEQNHAAPDGKLLSILAIKVDPLPIEGEENPVQHPDPFLYLEGGPGYASIYGEAGDFGEDGVMRAFYSPVLQTGRSLIAVDTRGLGFSRPARTCPEADRAAWHWLI